MKHHSYPQTESMPFVITELSMAMEGISAGNATWNDSIKEFHQQTIELLVETYGDRFKGIMDHSMGDYAPWETDNAKFWP